MTKKEQEELEKLMTSPINPQKFRAIPMKQGRTVVYMFPFSSEGIGVSLNPEEKAKRTRK